VFSFTKKRAASIGDEQNRFCGGVIRREEKEEREILLGISSIPLECVLIFCALVKINWGYSIWNQADFIIIAIKTKKNCSRHLLKFLSAATKIPSVCFLSAWLPAVWLHSQRFYSLKNLQVVKATQTSRRVWERPTCCALREKENIRAM
jgi:hypothetical protein